MFENVIRVSSSLQEDLKLLKQVYKQTVWLPHLGKYASGPHHATRFVGVDFVHPAVLLPWNTRICQYKFNIKMRAVCTAFVSFEGHYNYVWESPEAVRIRRIISISV